ncbi:unnamed protein product [Trichogramma brassicae]|uniref:Uncharacterized protein n=1 Tax=Trichogramma brassicae TaxID=86971 RepID=A0A6H5HSM3_9HYME|nr:unnamed protein product [Trichogramma brassicae]
MSILHRPTEIANHPQKGRLRTVAAPEAGRHLGEQCIPAEKDHMRNHVRNHVKNHMINHMIYHMISRAKITSTRRLRHYRSGLRALRRGRRPRERGSVAQPEQHDLSASRAASRRGAGEIHSRAAEQGRGDARRQALLPDHMSGEEVPSARQQFEGGDRADAFQGARISDGRARPARHVLQCESSRGLRKLSARAVRVLVAARGAAQPGARRHRRDLRESVGAVVILVEQVEDQPGVHRQHDKIKR